MPVLVATGLLCVVGLTQTAHPTAAWLSIIGASVVVTIDLATYAAAVRPVLDDRAWPWLTIGISLSALLATASAGAYAIGRPRRLQPWTLITAMTGLIVVAAASVTAVATAGPAPITLSESPLGNARFLTRALLVVVPLLTILGLIGDAIPPAERASRRAALIPQPAPAGRSSRVAAWLRAFADEVGPGRMRARRAVLDERSRIARDLHADVVPALRQALRDAEREVPVADLSATLRQILADVEGLGASRQPIQLEIGGLVPALEWLAERVEDRSRLEVTLSVAESSGSEPGAPPVDVAAAAFRVATLALDNVVRHAPGSRAEIWVRTDPDLVELAVGDQGPGIASDALTRALADGRRGIADMMSEAAASGAEVHVQPGADSVGTTVRFRWRNPSAGGR